MTAPGVGTLARYPKTRHVLAMAIAAIVIGLSVSLVIFKAREFQEPFRTWKDFAIDYGSARALLEGGDPYGPIDKVVNTYVDTSGRIVPRSANPAVQWHPPFRVTSSVPLALMPYEVAGTIWIILSAACIVGSVVLVGRELGWSPRFSLVAGCLVTLTPTAKVDFSWANVNSVVLVLVVASWVFLKRGKDTYAGIALGAAVATKLFPALLVIPLLGARRFRTAASTIVTTFVLTFGSLLIIGISRIHELTGSAGGGFKIFRSAPLNVSWWAISTRWLTDNIWVPHLHLDALGLALASTGAVLFLAMSFRPRARISRDFYLGAMPLILLAWPITWDAYLIQMTPWVLVSIVNSRGALRTQVLLTATLLAIGVVRVDVPIAIALPTLGLLFAIAIDTWLTAPRIAEGNLPPALETQPWRGRSGSGHQIQ